MIPVPKGPLPDRWVLPLLADLEETRKPRLTIVNRLNRPEARRGEELQSWPWLTIEVGDAFAVPIRDDTDRKTISNRVSVRMASELKKGRRFKQKFRQGHVTVERVE